MKKVHILLPFLFLATLAYSQKGEKLFKLLAPEETNIDFNNKVSDSKDHNILIYSNYYGGAGVGISDFNNDGLQDVFFAGNLVSDRLYINKGKLQFDDVTKSAGIVDNGGWSSGVVIGDINNDGWQDIYVTRELYDHNTELRRNKLYINTTGENPYKNVSFKESAKIYGLDDSERTRHAAFIDFDKDGHLDIFLLNQPPNPGNFSEIYGTNLMQKKYSPRLYKNNGNSTFTDVTTKAGLLKPGFANSVAVFDSNNDGLPDIYVSNDYDIPDFFYTNNGDGTFKNVTDKSLRHLSYFSMGVDASDINNDGKLDLMVVDMVAEDNYRIKSNMSGMNPEAFWKIVNNGGHYQYMFNTLQLNNGVHYGYPQFSDVAQIAGVSSTDWSWSNVIADFDNDGLKDIYVTNGLMRDIRNTDSDKAVAEYINKVANDFVLNNPNAGDVSIWEILDLDKVLSHIPSVKLSNYVYKNKGDLNFKKVIENWGLDQKTFSSGCAYGDLDNDGDLDLVVNNINEVAFIYENKKNLEVANSYLRVKLTDKKNNKPIFGARVEVKNGNTRQLYEFTSVRGMYSSSEQVAHFGLTKDTKVDHVKITWPNQNTTMLKDVLANQIVEVDYSDGKKNKKNKKSTRTLFETSHILDHQHIENRFDDYDKQVLLPHKQSQWGPAMAIGDINGDGLDDIFMGGAVGSSPVLFFQNKEGEFDKKIDQTDLNNSSGYEDVDAVFFDADNDGDQDLYVVSGGNEWRGNSQKYQDRLYLNDGQGMLNKSPKALPLLTESGSCVRPFDYDSDGDLDLFVGGRHKPWDYPTPVTSRILENKSGKFVDVTNTIAKDLEGIGLVTDAVWMDFDEDGLIDLILTGEWMPITFIRNNGKNFEKESNNNGVENTEGWWYSIEAGDIDNDGDIDIIAGNLGLNYKYKATNEEPFEVYYDDFDQNNSKDIVLSYYNFGEQFPLRGKSCSAQQIPYISKQYKSYNVFAEATLADVYGKTNLQSALHYEAKTFASSYFENMGKGQFNKTILPVEAQVSNVDDIMINDFDRDGNQDILIIGNMYPVEVETTRNDAGVGLFLKGNAKGEFTPISSYESGFFSNGDGKKMSLINIKGVNHIVVAINNGSIEGFRINKE